ncbi:MAG: NYN domain-containing protein [Ktedonobacteraceae bacterium]
MTAQNTQPEKIDTNEIVVQQSASETPVASPEVEVAIPVNIQDPQKDEIQSNTSEQQAEEESRRSFTDYIEEFRQNEVQYSSLVQDTERNESASSRTTTTPGDSILLEGIPAPVEEVASPSDIQSVLPVPENDTVEHKSAERQAQSEADQTKAPQTSPLLRHSSRARSSRQTGVRHHEEPVVEAKPQQEQKSETEVTSAPNVNETGVATETAVEEKPRPERRYRFDRRTPTASTTTIQPRVEENKGIPASDQSFQRVRNESTVEKNEQITQLTGAAQPAMQTSLTQEIVQEEVEAGKAEVEKVKPARTTQDRRRHGQERQREKVQTTSPASQPVVPEVTVTVAENIEPQAPAVAPEDLPPLEYAELQAASSRRRRKRRPGSSSQATNAPTNSVAAKPVAPEQAGSGTQNPSSPVSPPAAATRSITTSGGAAPSYSIQSGHTVSQMNQGNADSGPFMGPEPSPARGSGSSVPRTVRPIRNEVQRVPTYPVRSEGAASSASINHLANVVAQAIQTQSDRMAAELRRANQVPTNVSVSLPPFPSTERVGVFVDVANLLYSARTQRLTIDFGKLLDFLRGNRRLIRAHAYCPTSPQPGDDQMFLQAVKGLGYRITTKDYKTFSSGAKKADLDLDLCMDVVRLVDGNAVDCVVLVSGDGDFMPMLDYCSDHGVRVEVAAFDESMSAILRQGCDLFINLSMLDEIRA